MIRQHNEVRALEVVGEKVNLIITTDREVAYKDTDFCRHCYTNHL